MATSLKHDLVSMRQREISGSRSSARFSYQKNWALAELIEYHINDKNYVFAFEFHDDVLILDCEDDPTTLQFIQVKTKTTGGKWTISQLAKKDKGAKGKPDKLSILGKLYENKKKFASYTCELRFVTNAYFSFAPTLPISKAASLADAHKKKISEAIISELGNAVNVDMNSLCFEQSSLSVDDHEIHIRGKLHNFFETLLGVDHNVPVSPWYQSISDQIKRKNNYPSDQVKDFDDLIRNKCITKSEIENFITSVKNTSRTIDHWDTLKLILIQESFQPSKIIALQKRWVQYATDRLNYDNSYLRGIEASIILAFKTIKPDENASLNNILADINCILPKDIFGGTKVFDDTYINSIILWQYCEQL